MNCYKITADTRQQPNIVFVQTRLSLTRARLMAITLFGAFRHVEVLNEVTGEVELIYYMSPEFFAPTCSVSDALRQVNI